LSFSLIINLLFPRNITL